VVRSDGPALTRSDAWLLAAITEGSRGQAVTLEEFVHDCDYLNRAIPTFDEVSLGIPRLVAAGLVTVQGQTFRATEPALRLRRSLGAKTLGDVLDQMAAALGATPYPDVEPPEDRSRGRLVGLEPEDLEGAIRTYKSWFVRWTKPLVWAGHLLSRVLTALDRSGRG
jgi:hypothetical protein